MNLIEIRIGEGGKAKTVLFAWSNMRAQLAMLLFGAFITTCAHAALAEIRAATHADRLFIPNESGPAPDGPYLHLDNRLTLAPDNYDLFPDTVTFYTNGREVARIDADGNVRIPPGVSIDEASWTFWNAVRATAFDTCGPVPPSPPASIRALPEHPSSP